VITNVKLKKVILTAQADDYCVQNYIHTPKCICWSFKKKFYKLYLLLHLIVKEFFQWVLCANILRSNKIKSCRLRLQQIFC